MSFVSSFEEAVDDVVEFDVVEVVDDIEALRVGKASSCMLSKETIDFDVLAGRCGGGLGRVCRENLRWSGCRCMGMLLVGKALWP